MDNINDVKSNNFKYTLVLMINTVFFFFYLTFTKYDEIVFYNMI